MTLLTGGDFDALFDRYERTAFRLEVRDSYLGVDYEQSPFRRWQNGEPDDKEWRRAWLDGVRSRTAQGRVMRRVRVVTLPPTDFVRFSFANCADNVEAGEDIRYLDRRLADGLPDHDYWLFDDVRLYVLHFGEADEFLGAEPVDDSKLVVHHAAWRDDAWRRATPYRDFRLPP